MSRTSAKRPAIAAAAAPINDSDFGALVRALGQGGFDDTEKAVVALAASGDDRVAVLLDKLGSGDLVVRKPDGGVFLAAKSGKDFALSDPVSGADAGIAPKATVEKIKINNKLRRAIASAVGRDRRARA